MTRHWRWPAVWLGLCAVVLGFGCTPEDVPTALVPDGPASYMLLPPECTGEAADGELRYFTEQECTMIALGLHMVIAYSSDPGCRTLANYARARHQNNWTRFDPTSSDYGYVIPGNPTTHLGHHAFDDLGQVANTLLHEEAHHRYGSSEFTAGWWGLHCEATVDW